MYVHEEKKIICDNKNTGRDLILKFITHIWTRSLVWTRNIVAKLLQEEYQLTSPPIWTGADLSDFIENEAIRNMEEEEVGEENWTGEEEVEAQTTQTMQSE